MKVSIALASSFLIMATFEECLAQQSLNIANNKRMLHQQTISETQHKEMDDIFDIPCQPIEKLDDNSFGRWDGKYPAPTTSPFGIPFLHWNSLNFAALRLRMVECGDKASGGFTLSSIRDRLGPKIGEYKHNQDIVLRLQEDTASELLSIKQLANPKEKLDQLTELLGKIRKAALNAPPGILEDTERQVLSALQSAQKNLSERNEVDAEAQKRKSQLVLQESRRSVERLGFPEAYLDANVMTSAGRGGYSPISSLRDWLAIVLASRDFQTFQHFSAFQSTQHGIKLKRVGSPSLSFSWSLDGNELYLSGIGEGDSIRAIAPVERERTDAVLTAILQDAISALAQKLSAKDGR